MKINEKNLCHFACQEPFDKCGFLNKRGEVNKAWQKRWFVLKGNLLFYFEKRTDKEPIGMIILEGCTVEMSESEEIDQYCFKIIFHGPHNRTYILGAESQPIMESWMKALTCAGYDYMKLMVAELQRQLKELEGKADNITAPIAPPRRQAPSKPSSQPSMTNSKICNEGPLVSLSNGTGSSNSNNRSMTISVFQRVHDQIGATILKELDEYKQKKADADKPPDGPPLIIL